MSQRDSYVYPDSTNTAPKSPAPTGTGPPSFYKPTKPPGSENSSTANQSNDLPTPDRSTATSSSTQSRPSDHTRAQPPNDQPTKLDSQKTPSYYNNSGIGASGGSSRDADHTARDSGRGGATSQYPSNTTEIDHLNLEGQTITIDNQKCRIRCRITCGNKEYYAIDSNRSFTGYNGRCPCGTAHVHFDNPNYGYYALVAHIHEKVYGDQISDERSKGPKSIDQLKAVSGHIPPLTAPDTGKYKGIEGDANSCYMDSTIFCMFAYSDIFDTLLNKKVHGTQIEKVQKLLKENIVNVLRSEKGLVERDALFNLRKLLSDAKRDKSFLEEEKDPTEFLRALEDLFHFTPLKTIPPSQPPSEDQSNMTLNIMWEMFDANAQGRTSINIGSIFRNSLAEIPARLATIPPFLILIAPRHSRTERSYRYIIPDRQITLDDQMVQLVCQKCRRTNHELTGARAFYSCYECPPKDPTSSTDAFVHSCCQDCMGEKHDPDQRTTHKLKQMNDIATLDLFAVLCIERCHYVAFVKCHKQDNGHEWLFFDSMSDRVANEKNVPSVTRVPDFERWIAEAENNERFFEEIDRRRSSGRPTAREFEGDEMKKLRLFRDGAFFFYENSTANYH